MALFGALALVSCTGAKSDSNSEIVIGEFGSLTGTTATFGTSTKNGIDIAVDEINKAGGVLGRRSGSSSKMTRVSLKKLKQSSQS
jgi:branched-chain amino acid transport system substrate-binding protein